MEKCVMERYEGLGISWYHLLWIVQEIVQWMSNIVYFMAWEPKAIDWIYCLQLLYTKCGHINEQGWQINKEDYYQVLCIKILYICNVVHFCKYFFLLQM